MEVVIFGATGKIGQEMVSYIIGRDNDIHITAVGRRKENSFNSERVSYIPCDITDQKQFDRLPAYADAVINLAAAVTTSVNSSDVRSYVQANVIGAVNILDYCKNAGVDRILYAQTYNDVFGHPNIDVLIYHDSPRKTRYSGEAASIQ